LAGIFLAASYACQVTFGGMTQLANREPLGFDLLWIDPFDWSSMKMMVPICTIIMVLELLLVGWRGSSFRRLFYAPDPSARADWAFLLLLVTGLYGALIAISGFALFHYVEFAAFGWKGLTLFETWPLWAVVAALYLWRSFSSYWLHRLEHTRWLWPLHKTHHAARDFTTLNYLRDHPLELAWQTFAHAIFMSALGFTAESIAVFQVIVNTHQFINHSNAYGLAPLEKLGIVTPAGHRVHHGIEERLHNRNFGSSLNIWDRLFGTYEPPPKDPYQIALGVDEKRVDYNIDNIARAMWQQALDWLATINAECARRLRNG
jgi:sterol desaturase/sphingolipid hydroxylase (fatty acid hydroxylase superfamily)